MTASIIVGPSDGKAGNLGSIGVRFMIDTEETHAGGFSLVEHPLPPRRLAAPLHKHSREDEYSFAEPQQGSGKARATAPGQPAGHDDHRSRSRRHLRPP